MNAANAVNTVHAVLSRLQRIANEGRVVVSVYNTTESAPHTFFSSSLSVSLLRPPRVPFRPLHPLAPVSRFCSSSRGPYALPRYICDHAASRKDSTPHTPTCPSS